MVCPSAWSLPPIPKRNTAVHHGARDVKLRRLYHIFKVTTKAIATSEINRKTVEIDNKPSNESLSKDFSALALQSALLVLAYPLWPHFENFPTNPRHFHCFSSPQHLLTAYQLFSNFPPLQRCSHIFIAPHLCTTSLRFPSLFIARGNKQAIAHTFFSFTGLIRTIIQPKHTHLLRLLSLRSVSTRIVKEARKK